jgi:hypothetical protein
MANSSKRNNTFVALRDAYWKFAPARLKRELAAYDLSIKKKYEQQPWEANTHDLGTVLQDLLAQFAKPPVREMARHLEQQLAVGKLEAWGVPANSEGKLKRVRIDPLIFEGNPKIRYADGTIENLNRKFELVLVRRTDKAAMGFADEGQPRKSGALPVRKSNRPGRISKSSEIDRRRNYKARF